MDLSWFYIVIFLMQIDDNVMRKFYGYNFLKEYYEEESCMWYLYRIYVFFMLVNVVDDLLVYESFLIILKFFLEK